MLEVIPENSEQFWQGWGVDLTRSKPIGGGDDIIGLIIDWDGTKTIKMSMDVVLEDVLISGLDYDIVHIAVITTVSPCPAYQEKSRDHQCCSIHDC